jgi:hypothetical protein
MVLIATQVDTESAAKLEGYEDMIYCTKDDH